MQPTAQLAAPAGAARSRRIAMVLGLVALAFYVGTFLFWTPAP